MARTSSFTSGPLFRHQLVSAALMQSMVVLTLIFFVSGREANAEGLDSHDHSQLHVLAAAGCIALAIGLRNLLFSRAAKAKPTTLAEAAQLTFTPHLISMTLVEASVVNGFILAHRTGDVASFLALTAIGLTLSLIFFPTEGKTRERFSLRRQVPT